jgi:serine/threonine-protein kinase RsbW
MTELALNLILESHPKNIAEVEPFVQQVVREYEISETLFGNILITITEAVSNAIIHGNQAKTGKKVYISTECNTTSIRFSIEDEGQGFDPNLLPDPTAPENLLTPGGRGVFLMQHLSDHVSFEEGGRIVNLEFSLK